MKKLYKTIEKSQPITVSHRYNGTDDTIVVHAVDKKDLNEKLTGVIKVLKDKGIIKDKGGE